MKIFERLKELRSEAKLTQSEVSQALSKKGFTIQPYTISSWESGRRKPSIEECIALCDLYGVADIRLALTGKPSGAMHDYLMSGINRKGREHLKHYIDLLKENPLFTEQETEPVILRTFRLYDVAVSAGTGMYLDDSDYEEVTSEDLIPEETDYAVRVRGDSMEPKYYDDQILFIKTQETLENGEIGIFHLNGDAYLKKLDNGSLISLNSKYKPIKIREHDEFRVMGKVLGTY